MVIAQKIAYYGYKDTVIKLRQCRVYGEIWQAIKLIRLLGYFALWQSARCLMKNSKFERRFVIKLADWRAALCENHSCFCTTGPKIAKRTAKAPEKHKQEVMRTQDSFENS